MRGFREARRTSAPSVLRLLAPGGRIVENRVLVILIGLGARLGMVRAYALWPTGEAPMVGLEVGERRPAIWVREQLEQRSGPARGLHRLLARIDAATWQVLRARALVLGEPPRWLLDACGEALGRPLRDASIVLRSPTGAPVSKAICYLFEPGAAGPAAIVIAMSDPRQAGRLRQEVEKVEAIRGFIAAHAEIADALPLSPLLAKVVEGTSGEEYLAIYPPDPRDRPGGPDREKSLNWLRAFQSATELSGGKWSAEDSDRCLKLVDDAWRLVRIDETGVMSRSTKAALGPLEGLPVPSCAVHGDFWEGNLVHQDGHLRVFDWEWASPRGRPFLDPWTYEFGVMLEVLEEGGDLVSALADALGRIEAWLVRRDIDPRFGAATLPPSLAELAIRVRIATGEPGPAEDPLGRMMAAAERLLLDRG